MHANGQAGGGGGTGVHGAYNNGGPGFPGSLGGKGGSGGKESFIGAGEAVCRHTCHTPVSYPAPCRSSGATRSQHSSDL
jgi:hypothetical protein